MNRKIEEKRMTLIETAQKFGMNSKEAIQCSQELDNLLNDGIKQDIIPSEKREDASR
ncbi:MULTISPECIES: aspartyl-phosphate phosphatase Spo0E family protein [Bacillus]|uniref:aspartyl-phosphate phosphatase Spo0E family protein n=1 Tax=Bacillus TaxID=1386 RepID=UPI00077933DB|nr:MULTISPECIES: aspartyl-phosphate phosphatase Spo0E family protein [Bacillus]KAA6454087.1 aspartyl-phosphate phosphatase Spo0E family protein [Bacillus atrophaeus]MCG8395838.1 aspartyl-phosphate phosphatase Spo0E family protein [Bacillus atrophaeus]MCI3194886.1 aspartyl-phosphate phosphatase Spo0E family protein [Bacillus sp. HU-1818]MCY8512101.1 aspartyl-phosphate phosphatase Spo0E family protein [Bacillus atrophaeus]MCY8516059.1 aspartyl-phosphate phosphatase Spo0E family protein [Bacillus